MTATLENVAAAREACRGTRTWLPLVDLFNFIWNREQVRCTICKKVGAEGEISTGDILKPTMLPCCNSCFKDMVCP